MATAFAVTSGGGPFPGAAVAFRQTPPVRPLSGLRSREAPQRPDYAKETKCALGVFALL
jgi:hypothetical protein